MRFNAAVALKRHDPLDMDPVNRSRGLADRCSEHGARSERMAGPQRRAAPAAQGSGARKQTNPAAAWHQRGLVCARTGFTAARMSRMRYAPGGFKSEAQVHLRSGQPRAPSGHPAPGRGSFGQRLGPAGRHKRRNLPLMSAVIASNPGCATQRQGLTWSC